MFRFLIGLNSDDSRWVYRYQADLDICGPCLTRPQPGLAEILPCPVCRPRTAYLNIASPATAAFRVPPLAVKVPQYDRISHGDAPKVPLRYLHGAVTAKIYKDKAPYRYFEVILICQDRINASGAVPIKRCAKVFERPRPWVKGS